MSEQRFTAMETEWYRLATGAEPSPSGRASAALTLGRTMAEQYRRNSGIGHALAFAAAPAIYQEAVQMAADEQQYYARCQALGLPMSDARQVLDEVVVIADQCGLPMSAVWERAWQQAIEESMQPSRTGLDQTVI